MAITVLRSLGQHLHPVGPLTVTNMVADPGMKLADGSLNLTSYQANNCLFKQDTSQFKFGSTSAKFTVASTTTYPSVIQSFAVSELQDYTASMWVNIPTALSTGLNILANPYTPDGTAMATLGGQVLNGAATSGWIRTSILLSVPSGASRLDVVFVYPSKQPTSLDSFWLDGLQLEPQSMATEYGDGSMSGYVWAGAPNMSYTLKSEFPSALRAFEVGALSGAVGGMRAHASLQGPNIIPLQS